jgi:uncharacterized protein
MPPIDTVLVKIASRCNLDCSYCYVYHMGDDSWRSQPKLLSRAVETRLIEQLAELARSQTRGFSVVFHGGEPLLMGAARLLRLFEGLRAALPPSCSLHVQTNGLLLTPDVIQLCARYGVGISISLDGPPEVHDQFRVDLRGRPSQDRVIAAIKTLRDHPSGESLFAGILAVVDPRTDPGAVYDYLKATGTPSVDFLYRDGNHSKLPFGKREFLSTEYGDWMCCILDRYLADPAPPRIRILDDMLRLLLGGAGVKEGVGVTDFGILVIDTDGGINKNDTLKSAHQAADHFRERWSIVNSRIVDFVGTAEFSAYQTDQRPTSSTCMMCSELSVCGGGMRAHRWSIEHDFDNPSVFCEDQKKLIARMRYWITRHRSAA